MTTEVRGPARRAGSFLLLTLGWLALPAAPATALTPAEIRGKEIYHRGGNEIVAFMAAAGVEVPAGAVPCVRCHGTDGRGTAAEEGPPPPTITPEALAGPYGAAQGSERERPPYDRSSLVRAIAEGIDPAGNRLQRVMPRYGMSDADMDDLVAYLDRLGDEGEPGVTEDALRLGTLLPPPRDARGLGDAITPVLQILFDEVNQTGGIHGRRLELRGMVLPEAPERRGAAVEAFLDETNLFALVGAWIAGSEGEIASLVRDRGIPLVGPVTRHPQVGSPPNRQVFYLFPGLAAQGRILVEFATERHGDDRPPLGLVFPNDPAMEAAAHAASEQAEGAGWIDRELRRHAVGEFDAEGLARDLAAAEVEVLLFLDEGEHAAALMAAADRLSWYPELLAPGGLAAGAALGAPEGFRGRIFLSLLTLPSSLSAEEGPGDGYIPATGDLAMRLSTLAAGRVLVEALQRAGRDLGRERLLWALEGLYRYETGFTPPLSYGPRRRIGALGAHVVSIDPDRRAFLPTGEWRPVPD